MTFVYLKNLFIYLFLAVLGLHCCEGFFFPLVVKSRGCSLLAVPGLLIVVASLVAEHRPWGFQSSVVATHGLSSCASRLETTDSIVTAHKLRCSEACGIFPDAGNLCPLHWQAESLPLSHQGSPDFCI